MRPIGSRHGESPTALREGAARALVTHGGDQPGTPRFGLCGLCAGSGCSRGRPLGRHRLQRFFCQPFAGADEDLDGSRDPDDLSDYVGLYFSGCWERRGRMRASASCWSQCKRVDLIEHWGGQMAAAVV